MRIYDAIMKAADHIEANPHEWDFDNCSIPSCGTPGCALGWIGAYAGIPARTCIVETVKFLRVSDATEFYNRCRAIAGMGLSNHSPKEAAVTLRLYAAKYHAPTYDGDQPSTWSDCAWKPKGVQA